MFLNYCLASEFSDIMQQPPLIKLDKCNQFIEDKKAFNSCMLPYMKTADCRFRVKKSVYTEQNKKTLTENELQDLFLRSFHECFVT